MEEHERERRGPLHVLSGSPEKRIMGLGCGVGLSLSGFDHAIASSVKAAQKQRGSEPPLAAPLPLCSPSLSSSLSLSVSHLLSLHSLILVFFFPPSLFISLSITHALFFSPPPLSGSPTQNAHTHSISLSHTQLQF